MDSSPATAATPLTKPLRFPDLPPELRNRICHYVLVRTSEPIERDNPEHMEEERQSMALLNVNRQIRKDTLAIYYTANTFSFHVPVHNIRRNGVANTLHGLCFKEFLTHALSPSMLRKMKPIALRSTTYAVSSYWSRQVILEFDMNGLEIRLKEVVEWKLNAKIGIHRTYLENWARKFEEVHLRPKSGQWRDGKFGRSNMAEHLLKKFCDEMVEYLYWTPRRPIRR
jgi:hypothetical protein